MSFPNNYNNQFCPRPAQPPPNNEPLPSDWEMLMDPQTGLPFFVNHRTQQTTWSDPRRPSMMNSSNASRQGVQIPIIHDDSHQHQRSPQNWGPQYPQHHTAQQSPMETGRSSPRLHQQFMDSSRASPHLPSDREARASPHRYMDTASPRGSPHLQRGQMSTGSPRQPRQQQFGDYQENTKIPSQAAAWEIPIVHRTPDPEYTPQAEKSHPQQPTGKSRSREAKPSYHAPPTADTNHLQKPQEQKSRERSLSPAPKLPPLEQIGKYLGETQGYQKEIEQFAGRKKDKQYGYIEEMLTRTLLKLDLIEANGDDEIRQARKKTIRFIQSCLDQLELKAMSNETEPQGKTAANVAEMKLDSEHAC